MTRTGVLALLLLATVSARKDGTISVRFSWFEADVAH